MREYTFRMIIGVLSAAFLAVSPAWSAANQRGDATYLALDHNNSMVCWTNGRCVDFGPANQYGTADQCSQDDLVTLIFNEVKGGRSYRRVESVGGIGGLYDVLQRDQTGTVWAVFVDCGVSLGGLYQGILCVDLDEIAVDSKVGFEGCYYVTENKS
jgi:hypothetical protein